MGRAWLGVPTIGTALVAVAIASCTYHYAIHNDNSASLVCVGGRGHRHWDKNKAGIPLYKIEPHKTPDAFYITRDKSGACADYKVDGQGVWRGRALVRIPDFAYCGYTWVSNPIVPPPPFPIQEMHLDPTDVDLDPPAMAVQQAATSNGATTTTTPPETVLANAPLLPTDDVWKQSRYDTMRIRLGVPAEMAPHDPGTNVRVAVIDNASGEFYAQDADADSGTHGRAMGKLIEDVACTGRSKCGVEIRNYGALSFRTQIIDEKEYLEGAPDGNGVYGTEAELAQTITKATEEWLTDRASGVGPDHLVINLSLGWSGCWNSTTQNPLSHPVLAAILKATCQGALVVAAGGNKEALHGCPAGSPRANGVGEQVYPAQFLNSLRPVIDSAALRTGAAAALKKPAGHGAAAYVTPDLATLLHPSAKLCRAAGVINPPADLGPLLLGISAVDQADQRLSVAAQDSSLVAYGEAVTTPDGEGWTRLLTGTSLSAATVSGIAANVWATYPSRTPAQLEHDLIDPAVVLADIKPSGNTFLCNAPLNEDGTPGLCTDVRRVSLCGSLGHANGQTVQCAPGTEPTVLTLPIVQQTAEKGDTCSGSVPPDDVAPAPLLCAPPKPDAIDSMKQPWAHVGVQPPGDSCGSCIYWGDSRTFSGNLVDGTAAHSYTGAVEFSNGSFGTWAWLPAFTTMTKIKTFDKPAPTKPTSATLTYVRHSDGGDIYYYEGVSIVVGTLL